MERELYHCSPIPDITLIKPNAPEYFDKPANVSLTSLLPMALFYGIKHFEYTYGYDKDKKLYYMEHFPEALKKLYSQKKAYLYICESSEKHEKTEIPNELVSSVPVKVISSHEIEDLYEEILKQEKAGNLTIYTYSKLNDKNRDWIKKVETEVILEKGLLDQNSSFAEYMKKTYPASWEEAERIHNQRT